MGYDLGNPHTYLPEIHVDIVVSTNFGPGAPQRGYPEVLRNARKLCLLFRQGGGGTARYAFYCWIPGDRREAGDR